MSITPFRRRRHRPRGWVIVILVRVLVFFGVLGFAAHLIDNGYDATTTVGVITLVVGVATRASNHVIDNGHDGRQLAEG